MIVRIPAAAVVERYQADESIRSIARSYGCSETAVRNRLVAAGVELRPRRPQLDRQEVLERYIVRDEGIMPIAEAMGCSYTAVRSVLREEGVTLRPARGNGTSNILPAVEYQRTAFMYEQLDMSINEIADELGLNPSSVENRLRQHGVQMRSPSEALRLRFARRPKARAA